MGFYSNAGQNIAATEISDIAKIGGAVAGLVHASSVANQKNDVALAGQVKQLGEDEQKIVESEAAIEQGNKDLAKQQAEIQGFQDRYDKLKGSQERLAKMGFQDKFIDDTVNKLDSQISRDAEMYDKAMSEMTKKAKMLDIQKKNFEIRKQLIDKALERSRK